MRYIDEYRDADKVKQLAAALKKITTRKHRVMEVCGGQTHSIVKYGLDQIIPEQIELIHTRVPTARQLILFLDVMVTSLSCSSVNQISTSSLGR